MKVIARKILVGVILLLFVIVAITIINNNNRQHSIFEYIQSEEIYPSLNDGDIIFRLGDRVWSNYFKNLSQNDKKFSHLGIIRKKDNIVTVIHSEGSTENDYVKEVSLNDFISIAQSIGIYRLKNIENEIVSEIALEYKNQAFDWQFDMENDDKIYCTELLYIILKRLDPNIKLNTLWIKEIGKSIIPLDIYTQTEYFTEIGYWRMNIK